MQKGNQLTMAERRFILSLHEQYVMSTDEISDAVQRVRITVQNRLNNLQKHRASP